MNLKNKNLLVISPFPDKNGKDIGGIFVKNRLSLIKDYFKKIFVIEPIPYFPAFLTSNPRLRKRDYKYDNVSVYFPRCFMLPIKRDLFDIFRFKATDYVIRKYNIKFDLIHAEFTWPCGYIGAQLKEKYKKPLVVSVHGDPFRGVIKTNAHLSTRLKEKILHVLKIADKIHTPHPELYEDLCLLGFKEKSEMIYIPIDLNKFGNIERYQTEVIKFKEKHKLTSKKVILFLAGLNPFKDPITFIQCIPQVIQRIKNVVFVIVGDGILMRDILKEIEILNVKNYCRVIGQIVDTHIAYLSSDIFCALSPVENIWSCTVIEAFASRVPSIITCAGTTERYLQHKKTAYLIPPQSPSELAKAIIELLENRELRETLRKNERRFVEDNWNPNEIVKKWLNTYSSLETPE